MITTLEDVKLFLGRLDDAEDHIIAPLHNTAESWCKLHCDQNFESTTYAKLRNGTGGKYLWLKQRPVTAVLQVSIGRDGAIKVKNTDGTVTNAYVVVDSTKVTLVILGGTNDGSDEVDYATYDTLTKVVTQINTLSAKGWIAELADSDLASILATQLIEAGAVYCGARGNTTASYVNLEIPSTPVSGFEWTPYGKLYLASGFPKGQQNIYTIHVGGYSVALMPADIKTSIEVTVKHLYDRRDEDGFGVETISVPDLSQKYVDLLPKEVITVWNNYGGKRILV